VYKLFLSFTIAKCDNTCCFFTLWETGLNFDGSSEQQFSPLAEEFSTFPKDFSIWKRDFSMLFLLLFTFNLYSIKKLTQRF